VSDASSCGTCIALIYAYVSDALSCGTCMPIVVVYVCVMLAHVI